MLSFLNTYIINLISSTGYLGIFALMFIESCLIPIPSEATMLFAGEVVHEGKLSFILVVLTGAFANLMGSLLCYYIGVKLGRDRVIKFIRKYGKYFLVSEHEYEKGEKWVLKYGNGVSFFSRLLPGIRTVISLPCGIARLDLAKFSAFTFLGSLLWSTLLTYLGVKLGENWETLSVYFKGLDYIVIGGFIALVGVYIYSHTKKKHSVN